jgi:sugar transferase EpsL
VLYGHAWINEIRLGITGWVQVNGHNAITWEEKFKLDVWYVDNWSLWLDIKIIGMTVWKTLKREGINQPGYATAEEFMGIQQSSEIGDWRLEIRVQMPVYRKKSKTSLF